MILNSCHPAEDLLHGLHQENLRGERRQRDPEVLRAEQPSGHRQRGGIRPDPDGTGVAKEPERKLQREKLFFLTHRLRRLRRLLWK